MSHRTLPVTRLPSTLPVLSDHRTITTSWYRGQKILPPVVPLPQPPDLNGLWAEWPSLHTELTRGNTDAWPWVTTKRYLARSLSKTIPTRRLALPSHDAIRELAWAFALDAIEQSRFDLKPIFVQEVLCIADALDSVVTSDTHSVSTGRITVTLEELRLVRDYLSTLTERGETIIKDPWPPFDRAFSGDKHPWYTWDFFGDERLLDRVRLVHVAALQLYRDMIDRWFDGFRRRLRFGRLLPVRLDGHLARSRQPNFEGAPTLQWCARVVPLGEPSSARFFWEKEEGIDFLSYWKEEEDNLRRLRPGSDMTPPPIQGDAMKTIDSRRPATDLAHEWLIDDLKELSWTQLIMLPSE